MSATSDSESAYQDSVRETAYTVLETLEGKASMLALDSLGFATCEVIRATVKPEDWGYMANNIGRAIKDYMQLLTQEETHGED